MKPPASLTENPRFFGGRKWVFWSIALLPTVTLHLLLSDPCRKDGHWPAPVLLTIMVMSCLWEAHAQALRIELAGKAMLWHVCQRALRTLLSVIVAGLLPVVLLMISLANYACYADRARVSEAIASITESRQEIERHTSVTKTLKGAGLGLEIPKPQGGPPSNGFILEDGAIVLVVKEPPAAVLFTPKLVDAHSGAIKWSCRGYPAKSMPMECREPG